MNMHDTMINLAQGAINIAEGTDANPRLEAALRDEVPHRRGAFIEQGSRIAEALNTICALLPPGEAQFDLRPAVLKYGATFYVTIYIQDTGLPKKIATCKTRADAEAVVTCLNTLAAHFEVRR